MARQQNPLPAAMVARIEGEMAAGASVEKWSEWLGCGRIQDGLSNIDKVRLALGNPALPVDELAAFNPDNGNHGCLVTLMEVADADTLAVFLTNPLMPYWLLAHESTSVPEAVLLAVYRLILQRVGEGAITTLIESDAFWPGDRVLAQYGTSMWFYTLDRKQSAPERILTTVREMEANFAWGYSDPNAVQTTEDRWQKSQWEKMLSVLRQVKQTLLAE